MSRPANPLEWSNANVLDFLIEKGFKHYEEKFRTLKVNGPAFLELGKNDHALSECFHVVNGADRKKLMALIVPLHSEGHASHHPEEPIHEGSLCPHHKMVIHTFCVDEKKLMCSVCALTSNHEGHHVIPAKEAVELSQKEMQARKQTILSAMEHQKKHVKQMEDNEKELSLATEKQVHDIEAFVDTIIGQLGALKTQISSNVRTLTSNALGDIDVALKKSRNSIKEMDALLAFIERANHESPSPALVHEALKLRDMPEPSVIVIDHKHSPSLQINTTHVPSIVENVRSWIKTKGPNELETDSSTDDKQHDTKLPKTTFKAEFLEKELAK